MWVSHAPARNSRSARRALTGWFGKVRRRAAMKSFGSLALEAPCLSRTCQKRGGAAPADQGEHEEVDLVASEPPVGAVEGEQPGVLAFPGQGDDKAGDGAAVERRLLEEPLQAPVVRGDLGAIGEVHGEMAEVDAPRQDGADHQGAEALQAALAQLQALA
jgi:hypothetical protein